jgi:hypothetical protein
MKSNIVIPEIKAMLLNVERIFFQNITCIKQNLFNKANVDMALPIMYIQYST